MASKLLVVLVRDVKLTQIQDDQLKLVFDYILGNAFVNIIVAQSEPVV